jgi:K+-transporting ATPase ATPase C chain
MDRVKASADKLRSELPVQGSLPSDLVTASASGLDPHISPASAELQVQRVAKARGVPEPDVRSALARATEGRDLGFLGEPRVNVLLLNLALDTAFPVRK